jgi:hypothetical protein
MQFITFGVTTTHDLAVDDYVSIMVLLLLRISLLHQLVANAFVGFSFPRSLIQSLIL